MSQLTFPAALKEQLSKADSQFREGHFESADELYSDLLVEIEKLENAEDADTGSVVLKIAESRYAAGAYEKAKIAYEQLLALQEKHHDTSSKDRIFTFVKAARNYEKCEDLINAQSRYEQAYELAKTVLPVSHFLRRTVFECYAQWLRTQKSNPLVLSILESELGTSTPAPVAKESESTSSKPEKRSTESHQPRKGEEDFASLKSKLGKQPAKQSAQQTVKQPVEESGSTAQPAEKTADQRTGGQSTSGKNEKKKSIFSPQSKQDQPIDKQVAARKFLNFSLGSKDAKLDKSRLKSALVEDFTNERGKEVDPPLKKASEEKAEKVLDAEAAPPPTTRDEPSAAAKIESDQVGQELLAEAEELLKSLELVQQNTDVSQLISPGATVDKTGGRELKGLPTGESEESEEDRRAFDLYQKYGSSSSEIELEMERLLAESAKLLFNIESLNSPAEKAPASKSGVNADADEGGYEGEDEQGNSGLSLKGRGDVAMRRSERSYFGQEEEKKEKAEKFNLADAIEKFLPSTGALRKVLQIVVPIVFVITGICFAVVSNSNSKPEKLANAPKFMAPLLNQRFGTANGAIGIAFNPDAVEIHGNKFKRQPKVYFWQGTTNDELRLLQGTFKNCVWLRPSKEGMTTSDGQVFYSANAPETKVREIMNTLKTNALGYFSASGSYPNPEAVQPDRYVNPVTQRYDPVNICSMIVGKERPKDAETRLDLDLENGQAFNNEPTPKPGAVSVFCVQLGSPDHLPGTPEQLTTQSLYIHGYDRDGALLRTGANQKVMLIELKPNGPKNLDTGAADNLQKQYQNSDVCFFQGEAPSPQGVAFKYVLIALLISAIVGFFIWLQKSAPE